MSGFVRGAITAVVVIFAVIGAASMLGVDFNIDVDLPQQTSGARSPTMADGGSVETATTTHTTPSQPVGFDNAKTRRVFVRLLNEFRQEHGRASVARTQPLYEAARSHSEWMAQANTMAHEESDGSTFEDRVRAAGTTCTSGGENVAVTYWRQDMGADTAGPAYVNSARDVATSMFAIWRTSTEGHREIMLSRGSTRVGFAAVLDDDSSKIYATMVIC